MADMQFTPAQQCAIDSRQSTVLVSAAAGSGKTRVLTERLMAYLTDEAHPVDIDRFLVITFTKACGGRPPSAPARKSARSIPSAAICCASTAPPRR